jgi:hypothetical protein
MRSMRLSLRAMTLLVVPLLLASAAYFATRTPPRAALPRSASTRIPPPAVLSRPTSVTSGSIRVDASVATCGDGALEPALPPETAQTATMLDLAGASAIVIDLTNASTEPCSVTGWATVATVNPITEASMASSVTDVETGLFGSMDAVTQTLAPGASAQFFLAFGFGQGEMSRRDACSQTDALSVIAPGSTAATTLSILPKNSDLVILTGSRYLLSCPWALRSSPIIQVRARARPLGIEGFRHNETRLTAHPSLHFGDAEARSVA